MISGAEIMVKCLEAEGVKVIFGYPGATICPFYDKLYDSDIKHILVRQEQNAAHAASGFRWSPLPVRSEVICSAGTSFRRRISRERASLLSSTAIS